MNPHLKINRYVYFIPKRYKKYQKGKIIYIQNEIIGIKWKKGIFESHFRNVNLLYENFYKYYDYLGVVQSNKKNNIRNKSKLFDDFLIDNFYKFPENERIKEISKELENSSSKSEKEIRILYHYLKKELRKISFEYLELEGVHDNPIDRAENLGKIKLLLTKV